MIPWLDLISRCRIVFGGTLLYLGLRDSYVRGEANENGGMDIMMLLDRFTVKGMDSYRESWTKPAKAKELPDDDFASAFSSVFQWRQAAFGRRDQVK